MSARVKFSVIAGALSGDAREAVAQARTSGFEGLVLDPVTQGLDLTHLSTTGRREFRHLFSSNVQSLVAIQCDLRPTGLSSGADVDRVLWRLDQILAVAREVQAGCVTVDLGPLQPVNDSAVVALGAIAERYGLNVALSSSVADFELLDRVRRSAGCPWFGIDLDPVAMLRDRWSVEEIFSRVGDSILHVRAKDAILAADQTTKAAPLGRGGVNWPALLSALEQAGYAGWITVDPIDLPDRRSAFVAGLAYLRSVT